MRRRLFVLSAVALLLAAGPALAAAPDRLTLKRSGRWLTDSEGRVVVMHGVDIVKKVTPYYPYLFGAKDAEFLANEGFTAARIGFIWAGAEPAPGFYDNGYIEHVLGLNDLLARYGIRTLIDMHQDSWGTQGQGPASALCAQGDICNLASGDGAPGWATLGTSTDADFEAFWNNDPDARGTGIQTRFVDLWSHIVPMLDQSAAGANVIGLDPFNEPYPGAGYSKPCGDFDPCPTFERTQLDAFYVRVITAMRAAGYTHVIWPEGVADSGAAEPSLPAFTDPQVAFNWHYYCTASQLLPDQDGVISLSYCSKPDAAALAKLDTYAATLNAPWMVSEFGGNDADAEYAHEIDLMDSRFLTWTYWMYYNATLDPANAPGQGLLINDDRPGSVANVKAAKLKALVVPYAQAIAGTPGTYAFNRTTRTMSLTLAARPVPGVKLAKHAETQIFVPQLVYPTGYTVTVSGARVTSSPTSPWVELATLRGAKRVSVTIVPASGSTTLLPSQTGAIPSA